MTKRRAVPKHDPRSKNRLEAFASKAPDGLAAENKSVYKNLAENAWFPALYAESKSPSKSTKAGR